MTITTPYYEDMSRYSNSCVGWYLNKGPAYLRSMLDGKEEGLSGSSLTRGTMIHKYLLEKEDFWKDYRVIDFDIPSSKQQKDLCAEYTKSQKVDPWMSEEERRLTAYSKAYNNKKTEAAILTEIEGIISTNQAYLDYLKEEDKRTLISFADVNMLKVIEKNIKEHKLANSLLFDIPETSEAYNEFHINWDFPRAHHGINLQCKSLIDRVIVDHISQTITLIDIKTTVDVNDFGTSVDKYDYTRQLAYYWIAICWYMKNVKNIDVFELDYKFETYIIAIENNNKYQSRVFKITPEELENRLSTIEHAISEICWHEVNTKWDQYREYYEGDGSESIKRCF